MEIAEESNSGTAAARMIDEVYEFSAPRFFDFVTHETEEDRRITELWFESALAYAPSPFMPKIKTGRSFAVESLCDFSDPDQIPKETSSDPKSGTAITEDQLTALTQQVVYPSELEAVSGDKEESKEDFKSTPEAKSSPAAATVSTSEVKPELDRVQDNRKSSVKEACTPVQSVRLTNSKKTQAAKKIASLVRNPTALRPKNQLQSSQSKKMKPACLKSEKEVKNVVGSANLALENQAIKRQKLDGGKSRQIIHPKPQALPHKTKTGRAIGSFGFGLGPSTESKTRKEDRKMYVRESATPAPFISTAELMKKFQWSTRDSSLPSLVKTRLTLTRPKEPEFETAQRVRSVRLKSSAELEEEMLAKIPKFKARPVNKKILFAPSLPAIPRSTPQPPEFKEFRLETMSRVNHNTETASIASTEASHQSKQWKLNYLTQPRTPLLHTSLRARTAVVKSSLEIEQEELEKVAKFKARPLNKKIFESKGDLGVFCNNKRQITVPKEFHFATNERLPPLPPSNVADLFDKMSLSSESRYEPLPRITTPNPFHLHTEERGVEKERKFISVILQKHWEEERTRVPKANPYPYTTDFPVIPPKPEPKQCTRPEPFQLESLVRHEEEIQKEMEERQRQERDEAQMRIFKAQPILKEDPIPVPEKVRQPLTQVQEFPLHVDHRAVNRAEFDKKVKAKEMMYKRYREESEAAKMMEEEKALKQMRRTMVPQARPVPSFNRPFFPQKSLKENTRAKSPKLRVLQRKQKRNTEINSAISSAAANMR